MSLKTNCCLCVFESDDSEPAATRFLVYETDSPPPNPVNVAPLTAMNKPAPAIAEVGGAPTASPTVKASASMRGSGGRAVRGICARITCNLLTRCVPYLNAAMNPRFAYAVLRLCVHSSIADFAAALDRDQLEEVARLRERVFGRSPTPNSGGILGTLRPQDMRISETQEV